MSKKQFLLHFKIYTISEYSCCSISVWYWHLDPMQIPINFSRCLNPLYYKKLTICNIYHICPSILLCLNNLQYLIKYKCCINNSYTILFREFSPKKSVQVHFIPSYVFNMKLV